MNTLEAFIDEVSKNEKAIFNELTFRLNDENQSGKRGSFISTLLFINKSLFGVIDLDLDSNKLEIYLKQPNEEYLSKTPTETVISPSISDLQRFTNKLKELKTIESEKLKYSFTDNKIQSNLDLDFLGNLTKKSDLIGYINQHLPGVLPPLGQLIGGGAEGQVFEFQKGTIIKIFLVKNERKQSILNLLNLLKKLESHQCTTKILDYGTLARIGTEDLFDKKMYHNAHWVLYYVAEKAYPIINYDKKKIKELLTCLHKIGIDTVDVVNNLANVMQTSDGRYVLVDYGTLAAKI